MQANWRKVIYTETDESVKCIQGEFSDNGDFVEVKGDYKTILLNKSNIISIQTIKGERCR